MGKSLIVLFFSLAAVTVHAGTAGRALPETMAPAVVEGVFRVAKDGGEVHFTESADRGRSVFLRAGNGAVCSLERVEGGRDCLRFPDLSRRERSSCLFVFDAGSGPCVFKVSGRDLKESSLFGSVKSLHRSRYEEEFSAQ